MEYIDKYFAFQAGMLYERTRYCKEHFDKVYNNIKSNIETCKEMIIKRNSLKDLCYTPSEILETILIDINDQLYAQGSKYRVYLVKKFINFKIRVYYV